MDDNKNKVVSSQVMELQQLIAGPLIATIDADTQSAQKYLDYLVKIAFEEYPETGGIGKLRQLTFSYTEQDVNGTHKRTVNIPLLTLVPLPLLHVEEADFDFDITILDALTESKEERFSIEDGKGVKQQGNGELKMRASLAPQQGSSKGELQQSLAANMKVKVKMRQADMPAGLSNLLHITANNVQVEDADGEDVTTEEEGGEDGTR